MYVVIVKCKAIHGNSIFERKQILHTKIRKNHRMGWFLFVVAFLIVKCILCADGLASDFMPYFMSLKCLPVNRLTDPDVLCVYASTLSIQTLERLLPLYRKINCSDNGIPLFTLHKLIIVYFFFGKQ